MTILGIDPGLADTGWGVITSCGPRKTLYKAHGCIKTPANQPLELRLKKLAEELQAVFAVYKPQRLAIEELFFAKNVSSALPVAHARGAALLTAAQNGCPCFAFTPNAIKQAVAGSGAADKKTVQNMVKVLLGLAGAPQPNHAADALAAALCLACTQVLEKAGRAHV